MSHIRRAKIRTKHRKSVWLRWRCAPPQFGGRFIDRRVVWLLEESAADWPDEVYRRYAPLPPSP